jgi:hypothetical protein
MWVRIPRGSPGFGPIGVNGPPVTPIVSSRRESGVPVKAAGIVDSSRPASAIPVVNWKHCHGPVAQWERVSLAQKRSPVRIGSGPPARSPSGASFVDRRSEREIQRRTAVGKRRSRTERWRLPESSRGSLALGRSIRARQKPWSCPALRAYSVAGTRLYGMEEIDGSNPSRSTGHPWTLAPRLITCLLAASLHPVPSRFRAEGTLVRIAGRACGSGI